MEDVGVRDFFPLENQACFLKGKQQCESQTRSSLILNTFAICQIIEDVKTDVCASNPPSEKCTKTWQALAIFGKTCFCFPLKMFKNLNFMLQILTAPNLNHGKYANIDQLFCRCFVTTQ